MTRGRYVSLVYERYVVRREDNVRIPSMNTLREMIYGIEFIDYGKSTT
jgi:hypothetical protein